MKDIKLNNNTKIVSSVSLNSQCSRTEISPIDPMRQQSMEPVEFGNTARDVILYKKVKELAIAVENKQDKFDFIELINPIGTLDEEILAKVISNKFIEFEYQGEFYHLSISNLEDIIYIGPTTDPMYLKTVTVDKLTGEYIVNNTPTTFAAHVEDDNRHIRAGERDFWNNKLNYETEGEELILNRN